MSQPKTPVTVYSATWCAYCHMAMEYLKSKGVEYTSIDVDKEPSAAQKIFDKTGQAGVPVLEIGDETILGFDRTRIDLALRANHLVS
jgi:glutaredoxin-like YruB-family protein